LVFLGIFLKVNLSPIRYFTYGVTYEPQGLWGGGEVLGDERQGTNKGGPHFVQWTLVSPTFVQPK